MDSEEGHAFVESSIPPAFRRPQRKDTPHGERNARIDAHTRDPFGTGRRTPVRAGCPQRAGRPATRPVIEEAPEAENRDASGRGCRDGNRTGRMKTAEGVADCTAPRIAGGGEAFRPEIRPQLEGRSEAPEEIAVEMPACGLGVRDIEDAFRNDDGSLPLSRTAVSGTGGLPWQDCQAFAGRHPAATTSPVRSSTASRSGSARAGAAAIPQKAEPSSRIGDNRAPIQKDGNNRVATIGSLR